MQRLFCTLDINPSYEKIMKVFYEFNHYDDYYDLNYDKKVSKKH